MMQFSTQNKSTDVIQTRKLAHIVATNNGWKFFSLRSYTITLMLTEIIINVGIVVRKW